MGFALNSCWCVAQESAAGRKSLPRAPGCEILKRPQSREGGSRHVSARGGGKERFRRKII